MKYISKERWKLTNKLRNVLKLEKEKTIRRSLDLLHLSIDKKFNEIILSGNSVSLADLKNDIKGIKTTSAISIIDILETYINYFTKKVSISERSKASLQKYSRSKDLIKVFMQTPISSNVPILPPVQEIINKYKGRQTGLIPSISNQKMNQYLKELALICKINKKLT